MEKMCALPKRSKSSLALGTGYLFFTVIRLSALYDFTLKYKPGHANAVADALSCQASVTRPRAALRGVGLSSGPSGSGSLREREREKRDPINKR